MVILNGVNVGPVKANGVERDTRVKRDTAAPERERSDGVAISGEARQAAQVAKYAAASANTDPARANRVEAARQNLDRGAYKERSIVEQIAQRIMKYI